MTYSVVLVPTIKCSEINGSSAEKRRLFQANLCFPCRTFVCDVAEGLKISDRLMMYVMPTSEYVVGGPLLRFRQNVIFCFLTYTIREG